MKSENGNMCGRLQDLEKLRLNPYQILRALDDDEGLKAVSKETGLTEIEVGNETRRFVDVVGGAFSSVYVPRVDAKTGLLCW